MQQAEGALFSLGGAIWGFTPAAGHASPQQQEVPEAWLLILIEKHADAEFFLCLFRASRGARDWVLVTAPGLQLSLGSGYGPWFRQLSAAQRALATRGAKPVRVRLLAGAPDSDVTGLAAVPCFLEGSGGSVTELLLQYTEQDAALQPALSVALRWGAVYLPNLSTLHLACKVVYPDLPHSLLLPQLRHLTIKYLGVNQLDSIAEYLPQLITLRVRHGNTAGCANYSQTVAALSSCTSHTLTTFETDARLSDELLEALIEHTPALRELTTECIGHESDINSHKQWGVQVYTIKSRWIEEEVYWFIRELLCLPRPQSGHILIKQEGAEPCTVLLESTEGLQPDLLARLAEWRFHPSVSFEIIPAGALPAHDWPLALTNTLRQLASLNAPGCSVKLPGEWQGRLSWRRSWSAEFAQGLAETLPLLNSLQITIHCDDLTEGLMSALVRVGSHVSVRAYGVALTSTQYATAAWTWGVLSVEHLNMAQIAKLPQPPSPGQARCTGFYLGSDALQVAQAPQLQAGLVAWMTSAATYCNLYCPYNYPTDQALTLLQAQLTVLRAVRPVQAGPAWELRLVGWPLTREVMRALEGLPQWPCVLHIRDSQWPLEPDEYRTLAQHIPTSYCVLDLTSTQAEPAQAAHLVLGMHQHRESLAIAEKVQVRLPTFAAANSVRELVGDSKAVCVTPEGEPEPLEMIPVFADPFDHEWSH